MRQQGTIKREDMLELTRRMTLSRTCFSRIAGAYFDEEGYVDGTFNRHFQKLASTERQQNLEIAKAIPFSETNVQLKEYCFEPEEQKPGGIRQMLMALKDCGLKNDALLDTFYELLGEQSSTAHGVSRHPSESFFEALGLGRMPQDPFAIYLFYGTYDIPRKGTDHESQWESEEVYSFLIGAICAVSGDYEPEPPVGGFLFPAFRDRSGDDGRVEIFRKV
ncbi:MAG: DUF4317 domain-containing protein [Lachnospiraceae bacterium]|nr:DUF4317 domain-containing protein [Lachnospiraceae bacterium]